jgi:carbamoyltransferase
MLKMTRYAHQKTGMKRLCMAGDVALNCVANGRVLREVPFEDIWIQPAAGGAVGIALAIWHRYLGKPRLSPEKAGTWQSIKTIQAASKNGLPAYADGMKGSYLGPRHSEAECRRPAQRAMSEHFLYHWNKR